MYTCTHTYICIYVYIYIYTYIYMRTHILHFYQHELKEQEQADLKKMQDEMAHRFKPRGRHTQKSA